jgi:hypothetical protein
MMMPERAKGVKEREPGIAGFESRDRNISLPSIAAFFTQLMTLPSTQYTMLRFTIMPDVAPRS